MSYNVRGIRRFGQVIGQCEALTPAQNVGGRSRGNGFSHDLGDWNPEPPFRVAKRIPFVRRS